VTPGARIGVVLAGALVVGGCGRPPVGVTVASAALPPPGVAISVAAPSAPTTTTALVVATTTTTAPPPSATTAVAPTTTAPPPPAIATHDATLGALARHDGPVPVGVTAGADADPAIVGPVVPTGVDATTGELAVPADAAVVAWYQYGPAPGQAGSAVLAGHVDWHGVPGIFFTLRDLQPGDPITIAMSDGSTLGFHIVDTRMVDKPELPRAEVFARTGSPTLTLVTCGGQFDSSTHHYLSNVVVTAVPD
jgi:hypothetical protein